MSMEAVWNGVTARGGRVALKLFLVLLLPIVAAGCLQMERTVQVRSDGSGVLIERMVMSSEMVEMAAGMQPEGQPFNIRNDDELREKASNYGQGVRFLSAKDVETDFGKGYEARYAFDDINTLRVGQDVDDSVPGDDSDAGRGEDSDFTTFTMRGGNPAELLIHWSTDDADAEADEAETADASEEPTSPEQQMAMEMMKTMFKDMRMAMHVEVMGDIAETNATYWSGSRVTLMDIDFGELMANEEVLKSMTSDKPQTAADMKEFMKMIPGMKMEIEPEVTIRFF